MSHLDSRDSKLVDFLITSIEIARGFIVLNRPMIANELLIFSTSAVRQYADKYSIKIYDEDENWDGNFTILERSMDIKTLRDVVDIKEMYLDESTDVDSNGKKRTELSVIIDKSGNFAYYNTKEV